ncbi:hypothetical protein GCM10028773_57270 [Spirosoma koreense]
MHPLDGLLNGLTGKLSLPDRGPYHGETGIRCQPSQVIMPNKAGADGRLLNKTTTIHAPKLSKD